MLGLSTLLDRTHRAASNDISFEKWHGEGSNIFRKYEKCTFCPMVINHILIGVSFAFMLA
jgi:hypothetical protein